MLTAQPEAGQALALLWARREQQQEAALGTESFEGHQELPGLLCCCPTAMCKPRKENQSSTGKEEASSV